MSEDEEDIYEDQDLPHMNQLNHLVQQNQNNPPNQEQIDFQNFQNGNDEDQDNNPLRNHIDRIYELLRKITVIYGIFFVYSLTQVVLTIYQLWHQQLNIPVQQFYLFSVTIQFVFHTYYCQKQFQYTFKKMRQTSENGECPIDLLSFMNEEVIEIGTIKFYRLWEYLSNKELKLSTLNYIFYFWMFTLGNLVFVSRINEIDMWYLKQLLFPGWIVALATTLLFTLLCLGFPLLICYTGYMIRNQHRRRFQRMQRAIPIPVRYEQLQFPSGQPCYICLSDYEATDLVIQLRCHPNHVIHDECLRPWLLQNTVCPVCRKEIT